MSLPRNAAGEAWIPEPALNIRAEDSDQLDKIFLFNAIRIKHIYIKHLGVFLFLFFSIQGKPQKELFCSGPATKRWVGEKGKGRATNKRELF